MAYITKSFDDEIVRLLEAGGVGFMPSDTIYGLSCRALDEQAVTKLHRFKGREGTKPFIVLVSDIKMLNLLSIFKTDSKFLDQYWPGALSVIFPAPNSPAWLTMGTSSLAIRMPDYPKLRELINKVGPIISTSANVAGTEPAQNIDEAHEYFAGQLDFYIDVGELSGAASTLIDLRSSPPHILRQGAVKIKL